jgi:isoleucyl-tRNA synthetase
MDKIFRDLNCVTSKDPEHSVHLTSFPSYDSALIDKELEERMDIAQKISSMILGLRRKVNIKVRQPLAKIMVPVTDKTFKGRFESVRSLILAEVNVKEVEYIDDTSAILIKKIKPNFKSLGPKYGKLMKEISNAVSEMKQHDIVSFESSGNFSLTINGTPVILSLEDVEIISEDIPGWQMANDGKLTVALDITVTDDLRYEGIAREFVNRIQNIRKESGFDVTNKITVLIEDHELIREAIKRHALYIGSQTLATTVSVTADLTKENSREIDIEDVMVRIAVKKN